MSIPNTNKSNPCYERFAPALVPIRQPHQNADGEVSFDQVDWFALDPLEMLQKLVIATETIDRDRVHPLLPRKAMRFGTTKLATDTLAMPTKLIEGSDVRWNTSDGWGEYVVPEQFRCMAKTNMACAIAVHVSKLAAAQDSASRSGPVLQGATEGATKQHVIVARGIPSSRTLPTSSGSTHSSPSPSAVDCDSQTSPSINETSSSKSPIHSLPPPLNGDENGASPSSTGSDPSMCGSNSPSSMNIKSNVASSYFASGSSSGGDRDSQSSSRSENSAASSSSASESNTSAPTKLDGLAEDGLRKSEQVNYFLRQNIFRPSIGKDIHKLHTLCKSTSEESRLAAPDLVEPIPFMGEEPGLHNDLYHDARALEYPLPHSNHNFEDVEWKESWLLLNDPKGRSMICEMVQLARQYRSMNEAVKVRDSYLLVRYKLFYEVGKIHSRYLGTVEDIAHSLQSLSRADTHNNQALNAIYKETNTKLTALINVTTMLEGPHQLPFADFMNRWLRDHWVAPFPDDDEVEQMSIACDTGKKQIKQWLVNARTRKWRPSIKAAIEMKRPLAFLKDDSIACWQRVHLRAPARLSQAIIATRTVAYNKSAGKVLPISRKARSNAHADNSRGKVLPVHLESFVTRDAEEG